MAMIVFRYMRALKRESDFIRQMRLSRFTAAVTTATRSCNTAVGPSRFLRFPPEMVASSAESTSVPYEIFLFVELPREPSTEKGIP